MNAVIVVANCEESADVTPPLTGLIMPLLVVHAGVKMVSVTSKGMGKRNYCHDCENVR